MRFKNVAGATWKTNCCNKLRMEEINNFKSMEVACRCGSVEAFEGQKTKEGKTALGYLVKFDPEK